MRKGFKRATTLLLTAALTVACASCGEGGGLGRKTRKTGEGVLNISLFEGGYGTAWLENLAEAYSAETGTEVDIKTFVTFTQPTNQIKGDIYVCDLLFNITNNVREGVAGTYLPLDDVLYSKPTADENKTIYEKLGTTAQDYVFKTSEADAGHCYQLPWAYGKTGIFYNKTSVDTLLGVGSYELPRTTDELIAFCDNVKAHNGWSFVHTNSVEAEYYVYLRDQLAIQYMGTEAMRDYYNGVYTNEQGEKVTAKTGEELLAVWEPAFMSALETCCTLINSANGYTPPSVKTMDFMKAQAYFWGVTSQSDYRPTAFIIDGDWLYSEVEYLSEAKPADIRMFRLPINSRIIDKLSTVSTDAQLSECVRYADSVIDGGNVAKPSYLSDADAERIIDARKAFGATHMQQTAAIPKNTANKTEAENFLRFMASDEGCRIYSKFELGMCSPYSATIYDESAINDFMRSVNEVTKASIYCGGGNTMMSIVGGLGFFSCQYFQSKLSRGETAQSIWQENYDKLVGNYADILEKSKVLE